MALVSAGSIAIDADRWGVPAVFDFSPGDGRLASITEDARKRRRLLIFERGASTPSHEIALSGERPNTGEFLRISPAGAHVVVSLGDEDGFGVFDLRRGAEVDRGSPDDGARAHAAGWHPGGDAVAIAADRYVERWDFTGGALERREIQRVGRSQGEWVSSISYHADGSHFAAATNSPAVYVFAGTTGSPSLSPAPGVARNLAWTDDGQLLAAGSPNKVVVWRNPLAQLDPSGARAEHVHSFELPGGTSFASPAWEPGAQRLALGTGSGRLAVYDLGSASAVQELAIDPKAPVRQLVWHGDELVAWTGWPANRFAVWNADGSGLPTGTGDCTIIVQAVGPFAGEVPRLWSALLNGPDDRRRQHGSTRFDQQGQATFSSLPPGTYWVRPDTKADLTWGPAPRVADVRCRAGRTESVQIRFA